MIALLTWIYFGCNFGSAILLGCMLQTTFVQSSTRFRLVVGLLGSTCLARTFFSIDPFSLVDELRLVGFWGAVEVLSSAFLLFFLLLLRLRQRAAGLDKHPKQSHSHGFIPSC